MIVVVVVVVVFFFFSTFSAHHFSNSSSLTLTSGSPCTNWPRQIGQVFINLVTYPSFGNLENIIVKYLSLSSLVTIFSGHPFREVFTLVVYIDIY